MTLAGTRAALGSPEIDAAFRMNVTAVVSQRQRRRLPAMPDHLPGRPVFRLRRWAAAARGRTWPPEGQPAAAAGAAAAVPQQQQNGSIAGSSSSASLGVGPDAAGVAAAAAEASSGAPFPGQHVYISHDENDSDEYEGGDAAQEVAVAEVAVAELEDVPAPPSSSSSDNGSSSSSNGSTGSSSSAASWQPAAEAAGQPPAQRGTQALLHCRTRVTMAVRVPRPLRVVPNALLGYAGASRIGLSCVCGAMRFFLWLCLLPCSGCFYPGALPCCMCCVPAHSTQRSLPAAPRHAGSMLLWTVLSATLPSFLELLAADYRRWAGIAGTGDSNARQLDAPVGELFADAAAAVQEGRERRRQHDGGEAAQRPEPPAAQAQEGLP